jgi:hypothetical protein
MSLLTNVPVEEWQSVDMSLLTNVPVEEWESVDMSLLTNVPVEEWQSVDMFDEYVTFSDFENSSPVDASSSSSMYRYGRCQHGSYMLKLEDCIKDDNELLLQLIREGKFCFNCYSKLEESIYEFRAGNDQKITQYEETILTHFSGIEKCQHKMGQLEDIESIIIITVEIDGFNYEINKLNSLIRQSKKTRENVDNVVRTFRGKKQYIK